MLKKTFIIILIGLIVSLIYMSAQKKIEDLKMQKAQREAEKKRLQDKANS